MEYLTENSVLTDNDIEDLSSHGYSIVKKIGHGSFSQVFRAWFDPSVQASKNEVQAATRMAILRALKIPSKRRLACKVVEKSYRMPKDYPHKFLQREMNIMTKLNHPHIVKLQSILRKGPKFIMFMSLAPRGTLCKFILVYGPMKEYSAKRWFRQLILAIVYLHTMDIAHRDISCDNILITSGYNIKLCDFGYSCFSVTMTGWPRYFDTHCGSLPYVAPEIIRGLQYNPKYSDLWSLGVVLFVMLNGTFPFSATSYEQQYCDQMERNYSFKRYTEIKTSPDGIQKVGELLEPNPLLRISLQEILDSDWMADTNAEVPEETKKREMDAQKRAEDIKEENELVRGKHKKYSIQYPWIKVERETYFERLANLRKRHAMKGRGDGSLLPLYSFASKTSAATQGGSPPGTSWGTPDSNKKFNHWRNTDPDESDTSFNLKYQQLLGKKQSRFNPERRSTCVVS